jgi:serine/threonine protein kinase
LCSSQVVRRKAVRGASHLTPTFLQNRVGVGSRGQIFRATDSQGNVYAVKVLSREDSDTGVEICALRRVQGHPNVIGLRGPVEYSAASAFAVLDLCDTDMLEVVMSAGPSGLTISDAQMYFAQAVKALRHCHHKGVFHGDLKVRGVFSTSSSSICYAS